jgi:hypothetical protein
MKICKNCKNEVKGKETAVYCSTSCRNSAYQKRLRSIAAIHQLTPELKENHQNDLAKLRGAILAIKPSKSNKEIVGRSLSSAVILKQIKEKDAFEFWMNWSKLAKDFDVEDAKEQWLSFIPEG